MTRRFKRSVCRLLIGVLLFAQYAVAAHACQILSVQGARATEAAGAVESNSAAAFASDSARVGDEQGAPSSCDDMAGKQDTTSGNVCSEHCRYGHQTSDPAQLPSLAPATFAVLYVLPSVVPAGLAGVMPAEVRAAPTAASPPHTILHCCFRI